MSNAWKIVTKAMVLMALMEGCDNNQRKSNNPEMSGPIANNSIGTTGLPKGIFNFTLASQRCKNILNFVEAYSKQHLDDVSLVSDGECTSSKDKHFVERKVGFSRNGDYLGVINFSIDISPAIASLDKKPSALAKPEFNNGIYSNELAQMVSIYIQWVDENSFTTRDACSKLGIPEESCSEPDSSL